LNPGAGVLQPRQDRMVELRDDQILNLAAILRADVDRDPEQIGFG
jgi:hypothetical protein